jgi:hypothetical protein
VLLGSTNDATHVRDGAAGRGARARTCADEGRARALPPSLARARAAGLRSVRRAPAPERPPIEPVPPRVPPAWLLGALLERRPSGRVQPDGWRRAMLLLELYHQQARAREKRRRVSGCIRTGTHEAAARLAAAEQPSPDTGGPAAGGPDHTSVRRINALLEEAGAIECHLVEDDECQARGTDIRLLELQRPSPGALARAETLLERWTRERDGDWLAGVEAYRAKARRFDDIDALPGGEGAPPYGVSPEEKPVDPDLNAGARTRVWRPDDGNGVGEETGREPFAWPRSAAAAEQAVTLIEAFVGDEAHPIPELRLLRIAIWTRCHGATQIAAVTPRLVTPLGGLPHAQLRRLERDARAWRRLQHLAPGDGPELTLGALLLRLAACICDGHDFPGAWLTPRERSGQIEPRVLPVIARRLHALLADLRTEARRRRERRRAATAASHPPWLALDDAGRPRSDGPHGRYLAAHWLPTDRELDSLQTRHTLRAATLAAFGHVPSHVELRAEDGGYALIPLRRPGADRAHDPDRGPRRPWVRRGTWPSRARVRHTERPTQQPARRRGHARTKGVPAATARN